MAKFIFCIVLMYCSFLHAQMYYEASGQTTVFRLAAGETAEWNQGVVSVRHSKERSTLTLKAVTVRSIGSGMLEFDILAIESSREFAVYDIYGRSIASGVIAVGVDRIKLSRPLANGRYFVRISHSQAVPTITSFLVLR